MMTSDLVKLLAHSILLHGDRQIQILLHVNAMDGKYTIDLQNGTTQIFSKLLMGAEINIPPLTMITGANPIPNEKLLKEING